MLNTKTIYTKQLFKVHSTGKVGDWVITVTDNGDGTATLTRESTKVLGGTAVKTITNITAGKHIGKANETTPRYQAQLEALSKVAKQLDKGYVESMPQDGDKVTNSMGLVQPMLAHPIDKVKDWTFPVIAQPKLDGHRMLACVDQQGRVVMYSRQGKPINLPHIASSLLEAYEIGAWQGETLDGELYIHGETLQTVSSLVKKLQPRSEEVLYHIYDTVTINQSYAERVGSVLDDLFGMMDDGRPMALRRVYSERINHQGRLDEMHGENLAAGYEGTMIRWGDTGYENGKRSKSLLKLKDFQDAEFEIIGFGWGKPYVRPDREYRVPIFKCATKGGESFDVTAHGTMEEKDALANKVESYVGKMLTVKYFNFTPAGVPFLPVSLRFHETV
jgi:DNA ligase-1